MGTQWERLIPEVQLGRAQLVKLLEPVFGGRELEAFELLDGGLSNTSYMLRLAGIGGEMFVLRVYQTPEGTSQKETELIRLLQGRVPVPDMLYADHSCTVYSRPYAILRWMPGVRAGDVLEGGDAADVERSFRSIGASLAAIQGVRMPRAGFFGANLRVDAPFALSQASFMEHVEGCLDNGFAGMRLGSDLSKVLWAFCDRYASILNAVGGDCSLVHGDYHAGNVIVHKGQRGEWTVSSVLDWELAWAGSTVVDLGRMLRVDETMHPAAVPALVQGFVEAGGALPPDWKKAAKLADLLALLDLLNKPQDAVVRTADIGRLIVGTLRRWHEL